MFAKSKIIALLVAASLFALDTNAQERDAWRSHVSKEEVKFDVNLSSGVNVKNVIYRQPQFNDGLHIFLRNSFGLEIVGHDGKLMDSISRNEFMELMTVIIEKINSDHDGVLDGMYFDLGIVDELWLHIINGMRSAPIPPSTPLDPKSKILARQFDDIMRESDIFSDICSFASHLEKNCYVERRQIENVIIAIGTYMTPWGDAKHMPDASIDRKHMWAYVGYK